MIDHETDLTTPIKRRATLRRNLYEEICSPDDLAEPNVPQIDSGIVCQVQSALAWPVEGRRWAMRSSVSMRQEG